MRVYNLYILTNSVRNTCTASSETSCLEGSSMAEDKSKMGNELGRGEELAS